ncbi:hypothetical protein KAK07_21275, partial [Ideonella sp. 4Y16]|nr:hypothetical protein [Ideonella alba]MBQ0945887.1 hypothetical protein [Ideonella alba]
LFVHQRTHDVVLSTLTPEQVLTGSIHDGAPVRVYNLAKTITDCFKLRSKVGLDVALEALREAWQQRKVTMDDLWRYAKVNRMTNVMRPYLEALTG